MFLDEINRIYEMIHPSSFLSRYAMWWTSHEDGNTQSDEHLDFGLLILRLCLLSLQSLPHPKYPASRILNTSPESLERRLYALANNAQKPRRPRLARKRSLTFIHCRFYHVCYLKNKAEIRESWHVLSETVNDAHELGLHLRDPGVPLSDLEMELRRRTFWNLYVWDRFMCTFLGRWPLIPEGYFDIDFPHDNLQALITSPYLLTPFTDRIFHIKIAVFMSKFMSGASWTSNRKSPQVVTSLAQRFQEEIIESLPPPYKLTDTDASWDIAEPSIAEKRESLHLVIHGTRAGLYSAFTDPWGFLARPATSASSTADSTSDETTRLRLAHHGTLVHSTCGVISSITKLYALTGGDECSAAERSFMLPMSLVEAIACLGMCLLSSRLAVDKGLQVPTEQQERLPTFSDAFSLLRRQARNSNIAKRGVAILGGLHGSLCTAQQHSSGRSGPETPGTIISNEEQSVSHLNGPDGLLMGHLDGSDDTALGQDDLLVLPDWIPSFMESPSSSWFFDDNLVFGGDFHC